MIGLGQLQLKPWELEQYTLSEFFNAMEGLELALEIEWAQARFISYYTTLPHVKKGKRLSMTDLLELPTFDKKKGKSTATKVARGYRLTPDEIKAWHAGTWLPPDRSKNK